MDTTTLSRWIKEIGRGKNAARDLSREDAQKLFAAMLAGDVADLQLGAILIALRVKGESLEELAGFAAACEASYAHLSPLSLESQGERPAIPVVIPSYNGARQLPNLVPLLALLLAREGIPALVHGVTDDTGRVTTREVFAALGIAPAISAGEARHQLATVGLSFLPIQAFAPEISALLALRRELGVRNSTHTLVKMLQPCSGPAVRIVSVTHPEYLVRMREYFTTRDEAALLLRGAEGEAVAHPRRERSIEWAFGGDVEPWVDEAPRTPEALELPDREPRVTAQWIEAVLAGQVAMPRAIEHQLECCRRAVAEVAAATGASA